MRPLIAREKEKLERAGKTEDVILTAAESRLADTMEMIASLLGRPVDYKLNAEVEQAMLNYYMFRMCPRSENPEEQRTELGDVKEKFKVLSGDDDSVNMALNFPGLNIPRPRPVIGHAGDMYIKAMALSLIMQAVDDPIYSGLGLQGGHHYAA